MGGQRRWFDPHHLGARRMNEGGSGDMTRLAGRRLALGITGSIAAYKSIELLRLLQEEGADVRVLMTRSAVEFVGTLTLETLSRHPVGVDVLELEADGKIGHIETAHDVEAIVVAPATAHWLGAMANGLAGDTITAACLAASVPVVVAPAMDGGMYAHPATQANVARLRQFGYLIVEPEEGPLASGMSGKGRLAALVRIVDTVVAALSASGTRPTTPRPTPAAPQRSDSTTAPVATAAPAPAPAAAAPAPAPAAPVQTAPPPTPASASVAAPAAAASPSAPASAVPAFLGSNTPGASPTPPPAAEPVASSAQAATPKEPAPSKEQEPAAREPAAESHPSGRTDLSGLHVVITAGGTAEPIDPVRFVGNRSTGKMGVAIARIALDRGAAVTLILGNASVEPPAEAHVARAETAAEMQAALRALTPPSGPLFDVLVMAAAVADFRPRNIADRKLARSEGVSLELESTPDLLAETADRVRTGIRASGAARPVLVGFSAETGSFDRVRQKLKAKGVDLLVANDVSEEGSGFGTDTNRVTIYSIDEQPEEFPMMAKTDVAEILLDRILQRLDRQSGGNGLEPTTSPATAAEAAKAAGSAAQAAESAAQAAAPSPASSSEAER
jgi:phosphopantothenoylcysteine decarboxylase/phosphopantothenate--cysteine ligase